MEKQQLNQKNDSIHLKDGYQVRLEKSFILSLSMLSFLFFAFPTTSQQAARFEMPNISTIVEVIPPTEQNPPPVKPELPKVPVEADEDEIIDPVQIDFLKLQKSWISNNPPPVIGEDTTDTFSFIAVSEKPKVLKSFTPKYPDLAASAGITGMVVVKVLIGKKGDVEKAEIYKSIPMLDETSLAAALKFKFKPGKQRDKFVKVWMTIPFNYRH